MIDVKNVSADELLARKQELAESVDGIETREALDEVKTEIVAINAELEERKAMAADKEEIRSAVASGAGVVVEERKEEKKMDVEIRNTKEYINAYAEYLKTGDDHECRALLTENVSGTVAVPAYVENIVRNAWERNTLANRVRKAYVKGNLKVGFEISSTGAVVHTEGAAGVSEETLVLGIVELVPASIKKWISVSDEALGLRGEAFLDYIYDELINKIAQKALEELLDKIDACGTVATTTQVAVAEITASTITLDLVSNAMSQLSDAANNPVIVMNKATWGAFKAAQIANGYAYDPFEGLDVEFSNHLKSFATASSGDTVMIVGDFGEGALFNFPDGEEIKMTFDNITMATADLVKVVGRQYVGIGVVGNNAFAKVSKA